MSSVTYYLVECRFAGEIRYFREADIDAADRDSIVRDLIAGQIDRPVRVIVFNVTEGWSRDVSAEIALDVARRAAADGDRLVEGVFDFCELHAISPLAA